MSVDISREKLTESSKPKSSILEFVSTVKIPATTAPFVAKAKFVVATTNDAPVKISHIDDNFKELYLKGGGKIERQSDEQTLFCTKVRKQSLDAQIITELGGEVKSETTLSVMFFLMEKRSKGKTGVLLKNGFANIFYIRDIAGLLRMVYLIWNNGGWGVNADPVEGEGGWGHGRQVFSYNYRS